MRRAYDFILKVVGHWAWVAHARCHVSRWAFVQCWSPAAYSGPACKTTYRRRLAFFAGCRDWTRGRSWDNRRRRGLK